MPDILANDKYRRSTRYTVAFPSLPSLTLQPRRVEIIQKPYHHDVLTMELSQFSPLWFELLKTGVPVSFSWEQGSLSNTWVGYVSFVTKQVAPQNENNMEVHCVGSSFPLKERATRVFSNMSIPAAVKQIVEEFDFKFIGDDNNIAFDQLTIAGHSYWEWIHEQAKRIGYAVVVDNLNFSFRPLDQIIQQKITSVPLLSMTNKGLPMNNQLFDRTLDMFNVINGEHVEYEGMLRTNKTVGGVDIASSKVITSTSSPKTVGNNVRENVNDVLFSEVVSDQVANGIETATALAQGAAQLGRFNMPARIKCQGDPRIAPFSPVLIQGTGDTTDGFWIATNVKHMFVRQGDYQIEMKAVVDGTGADSRTTFKSGTKNVVGVVNLTEALKNGSHRTDLKNVALKSKSVPISETKQGFVRTPAKWKSVAPKGKK